MTNLKKNISDDLLKVEGIKNEYSKLNNQEYVSKKVIADGVETTRKITKNSIQESSTPHNSNDAEEVREISLITKQEWKIKEKHQDIIAREKALEALESDIQVKNKIRVEILEKIFNYLQGITVAVLFLIMFGKAIGIGNSVEVALVGTVLGSVISTIVLFCKYAFSDSTNLVDLFLSLSENKKGSTNKKDSTNK